MLSLERDLAVALSSIEDEGRAMRTVVEALAPPHRVCGVAVMALFPEGRREESRGPFAEAARKALGAEADRNSRIPGSSVVSFGDEQGGLGRIALVSEAAGGPDPAIECSLERIGIMLSATLKRIETTKRLGEALRDRDLLMREIRHRIRNSLQLVINMAPLMLGGTAGFDTAVIEDFEKRITALISIHDMLTWTELKDLVSARTYFWLLADAIRRVMTDGMGTLVSRYDSDEDPELPVDRATTIGLVVHELVTNSTKHALGRPVRMDLRVSIEGRALVLRYSDLPSDSPSVFPKGELCAETEAPYGYAGRRTSGQGIGTELVSALLSRARGERTDDASTPHRFEARFPLDR